MSNPWTPGPWRLNEDNRHVGADGETIVGEAARLNPAEFARVAADRALIAAAPKMAEALALIASGMPDVRAPHRFAAAQTLARDLLARIRGDVA